jgi:3'(2'), 5'-bisphosphate nucleotidase
MHIVQSILLISDFIKCIPILNHKKCAMRQINLYTLLTQLLPVARSAGDAIMTIYASCSTEVLQKEDASPVTEADLAAHRVLATQLAPLLPDCPVVSEEDAGSQAFRQQIGRFWLIDPLDGTK